MQYFLIQRLSSFLIFLAYLFNRVLFITVSVILKLSIFPFIFWYINLIYTFPNFIFFLASTLHKIPVILMLSLFSIKFNCNVFWASVLLSTFFAGILILNISDLRLILVVSSVGNNSWFLLRQISNLITFFSFLFVYSFSLFICLFIFSQFLKLNSLANRKITFWVVRISGLPPFPLFFIKIYIVTNIFLNTLFRVYFLFFLLRCVFIVVRYISSVFKFNLYNYGLLATIIY